MLHDERWTERLSDYLDGGLSTAETREVEEHVTSCEACAHVLDGLAAVVARARDLEDREPERDLWPSIRASIDAWAAPSEGVVVPLRGTVAGVARRPARRITLGIPQLAAAALALMLGTGAAGWFARSLVTGAGASTAAVDAEGAAGVRSAGTDPHPRPDASGGPYADELARLQAALASASERLAPHTVRILEKNLATIDRAIAESLDALTLDPGNRFLEEHLRRAYERKVEYLREAAALVDQAD